MADKAWEATLDRVLALTVVLGKDMATQLARDDLNDSRAHIVWELAHRGPSKQAAIAAALGVTPRAVTSLVDALVAGGIVTREPHPTDRRATLVTLTERGDAVAHSFIAGHRDLARRLFADVPADQLDTFHAVIGHVLARLPGSG
jgi:DNA-binding MarR family transcriptional regulator